MVVKLIGEFDTNKKMDIFGKFQHLFVQSFPPVWCTEDPSLQRIISFVLDYQITCIHIPHPGKSLFLLGVFLIK